MTQPCLNLRKSFLIEKLKKSKIKKECVQTENKN